MIRFTRLLPAAVLAACIAAPAMARDLTVVSWGGAYQDAQRELYFEPFKAAGTPMHDESWDGGIGVLRAKVEGGDSSWDVVQVESEELALGCEEGLFQPLNWDAIGGRDAYLPAAVNDCGVGAIVYNFILAYDGAKFKDGPKSWADFWDVKKFPGTRALRNHPLATLEAALLADGVAPDKIYPLDVDRAFRKLEEIKPNIAVWWTSGAQSAQLLADGEADMIMAWNGRVSAVAKEGAPVGFTYNQGMLQNTSLCILKGAPNLDAAVKFINAAIAPDIQANFPAYIDYGPGNPEAYKTGKIAPERAAEMPSSPDNAAKQVLVSTDWWSSPAGEEVLKRWASFIQQ